MLDSAWYEGADLRVANEQLDVVAGVLDVVDEVELAVGVMTRMTLVSACWAAGACGVAAT